MKVLVRAFRFFTVVAPSHRMVSIGLVAAVAISLALALVDSSRMGTVAIPIFLLQAIGSSSGFASPARRGHYDLLLTMGCGRVQAGLAHWALSIWPGIAAWLGVIAAEAMFSPVRVLMMPEATGGMVLASTVPWALTVPLPRLTGGLAIVIVCVSIAAAAPPHVRALLLESVRSAGPLVLVAAVVASAAAMFVGIRFISRIDIPLEAGQ